MNYEPALKAALTAIFALLAAYGLVAQEKAELWIAVLLVVVPLAQGWYTRQKVMPTAKLHDAGINPASVNAKIERMNGK
jgi:hypothetical protein